MKRNLLKTISPIAALAVGATGLVAAMGQPSQAAFPNKVFGCNVPGANAQRGAAPNALIASPMNVLSGYPVQMTIGVFTNSTTTGSGIIRTGAGRCLQAMNTLNQLTANPNLVNTLGVTYQLRDTNGDGRADASTVCLVPSSVVGAQNCSNSVNFAILSSRPLANNESYVLFDVEGDGADPELSAATAAQLLGSPIMYNNPIVPGRQVLL
ncbi:MAG: hypothetical protein AAF821_23625 [Cyanobacteria bacterium P01_D01_bin.156]